MYNSEISIQELTVITLNINSLISNVKRAELQVLLQNQKPDILLLCETKLNIKHKLKFKNYNFIRNDRKNSNGGGTAILIKEKFKFEILPANLLNILEYTAIKIPLSNGLYIYFISIYNNMQNNNLLRNDLDIIFDLKTNVNDYIICGGDFNARHTSWNNINNNLNGNSLRQWLDQNLDSVKHLYSANPTRVAGSCIPSYIDFFITSSNIVHKATTNISGLLNCIDIESDHKAVELKIDIKCIAFNKENIEKYNFKKANWYGFWLTASKKLSQINLPSNINLTCEQIDQYIMHTTNAIIESQKLNIPMVKSFNTNQLDLPEITVKIIKQKNYLRRVLYRNPLGNNAQQIKSQINCLNVIIKEQVQVVKDAKLSNTLKKLKNDQDIFKKINSITNRKPFPNLPDLVEAVNGQNVVHTTPIEKVNALGRHYEKVHRDSTIRGEPSFVKNVDIEIKQQFRFNVQRQPLITQISNNSKTDGTGSCVRVQGTKTFTDMDEIKQIIKTLKPKKSSGFDEISNYIIKKLPVEFHRTITIIINNCLNIGYFPSVWKNAKILSFPKVGKTANSVTNYRPISLLSCMSKLLESVIRNRLQQYSENKNIIKRFQLGFEKGLSPQHATLKLSTDITTSLQEDKYLVACSLDIEKAFDSVWIEGLIYKLKHLYNFPEFLLFFLYSYLKNRTFQVFSFDNGCKIVSEIFDIVAGTAQGSILAPLLFNLYLSDFPSSPPQIPQQQCHVIMYADDTILYCSNHAATYACANLNAFLYYIDKYFQRWKIKLNHDKTQAIAFRRPAGRKRVPDIDIQINRVKVTTVNKLKYLGVIFTNLYKFSEHVKHIKKKCDIALGRLRPVLNPGGGARKDVKILLYKQLIRPIMTYSYFIWFNISRNQMDCLCKIERKALRYCIDFKGPRFNGNKYISNDRIYNETNITPLTTYSLKLALNTLENIKINCNNELICQTFNIQNTDTANLNRRYRSPQYLLHAKERGELFDNDGTEKFYNTINQRYPPRL